MRPYATQRAPSHEVRGNTSVLHIEKDVKHQRQKENIIRKRKDRR